MTAEASLRLAARVVARAERVPVGEVLQPRGRQARGYRHVAFYLAHVALGQPLKVIARAGNIDRNTMRSRIRDIEDRRDDPRIDRKLQALEEALTCAA